MFVKHHYIYPPEEKEPVSEGESGASSEEQSERQQLQHHHRPRRGLLGLPVRFDDVGQTWPPLQGAEQAPGAVQAALLPPPGHPDRHLEHLSMRKDSPPGKAVQLLCRKGDSQHQEPVGGVEELVGKGGNLRTETRMYLYRQIFSIKLHCKSPPAPLAERPRVQ